MEIVAKAAVLGIAAVLIALLLKKSNPEMALLLTTGAVIAVLVMTAELAGIIAETLRGAMELSGLSPAIFSPVFKCVGIGIITRIAADICKDAGQSSVASSVELAGTAAALCVSIPLLKTLLKMIGGFL